MSYILISFIIVLSWWIIFGGRYTTYLLSLIPPVIFFAHKQYLYGTVLGFLMCYLTLVRLEQLVSDVKRSNIYKRIIVGIIFSSVPFLAQFTPSLGITKKDQDPIIFAIVSGLIITFVAASLTITAGMKRIKGDKKVHE